jgi:hypothetical protein
VVSMSGTVDGVVAFPASPTHVRNALTEGAEPSSTGPLAVAALDGVPSPRRSALVDLHGAPVLRAHVRRGTGSSRSPSRSFPPEGGEALPEAKVSVAIGAEELHWARSVARREGKSLSAVLTESLAERRRLAGLREVVSWTGEGETPLSREELAAASRELTEGAVAPRRRSDQVVRARALRARGTRMDRCGCQGLESAGGSRRLTRRGGGSAAS